jgi:hypothetical protein
MYIVSCNNDSNTSAGFWGAIDGLPPHNISSDFLLHVGTLLNGEKEWHTFCIIEFSFLSDKPNGVFAEGKPISSQVQEALSIMYSRN